MLKDIGLKELSRSIQPTRRIYPGARDFLWLFCLLFFLSMFLLVIYGSGQGFLQRMRDVILSYQKGYGSPIWLVSELNVEGKAIDGALQKRLKSRLHPGESFFGYFELDINHFHLPGIDPYGLSQSVLPSDPIWLQRGNENQISAWAVAANDPLMRETESTVERPLQRRLLLNERLFRQYFRCAPYVAAVRRLDPRRFERNFADDSGSEDPLWCLKNRPLWLQLNLNQRWETHPFRIQWANFATVKETAMLMPLPIFLAARLSWLNPQTPYFPEAEGSNGFRVDRLKLRGMEDDGEDEKTDLAGLFQCLGAKPDQYGQLELRPPQGREQINRCAQTHHIAFKLTDQIMPEPYLIVQHEIETPAFRFLSDGGISLPCDRLRDELKGRAEKQGENCLIDMVEELRGFPKGIIYAQRERPDLILEEIEALQRTETEGPSEVRRAPFYVPQEYKLAVVRFSFLSSILREFKPVYGFAFVGLGGVILSIFLLFLIDHRKHRFGIFLAKGLSWLEIRSLFLTQISLVFSFSFGLAALMVKIPLDLWLTGKLASILSGRLFRQAIHLSDHRLLQIGFFELAGIFLVLLLLLNLATLALLRFRLGKNPEQTPSLLIGG